MSQTVAVAGASGVVGGHALDALLERQDVVRVVALGRRPLDRTHPKLEARTVDLTDAEAVAAALPARVDVAISALGTTIRNAGSREAFRRVDHDAVVAFARGARARGATSLAVVSSLGADASARSFYLRVKGETEEALGRLGVSHLVVLRPSLLDDLGQRSEFRLGERIALPVAKAVFSVLGRTRRWAPIGADRVGRALVRLALDGEADATRIVESEHLHVIGA